MKSDTDALRTTIELIYPLNPEEMKAFLAVWKPLTAKRKVVLTAQGEVATELYFVREGLQRVYYLDEQGREATLVFTYAPSFGGVIDSFLLQVPSRYYYETLTPSTFLKTSFSEIDQLMLRYPAIERMIRLGTNATLSGLLERLVEVQLFSSEEKFRSLLRRSPHILQRVPHKYLASYLGIDATNFSKLLNKVRL
ncbi:Crp/Fnr family transcriptional regulator [Salmonirosea aquatica]|uniref:Cyclic nucleotide-binding domain-containing protein n=1 Tax=Salmonirosea aquatica TaxID=2654236 RepID=A0A7C9FNK8_9BACT|nr:cyclic nucleotide-binding domain-containing protein [Cytophagaceae bacterium SJW1-29]